MPGLVSGLGTQAMRSMKWTPTMAVSKGHSADKLATALEPIVGLNSDVGETTEMTSHEFYAGCRIHSPTSCQSTRGHPMRQINIVMCGNLPYGSLSAIDAEDQTTNVSTAWKQKPFTLPAHCMRKATKGVIFSKRQV